MIEPMLLVFWSTTGTSHKIGRRDTYGINSGPHEYIDFGKVSDESDLETVLLL